MALTDKLTAIGSAIRDKTGSTDLLTLDEMPTAISNIQTGSGGTGNVTDFIPESAFTLTGDCDYKFANNGWNWFIENYSDRIITNKIADVDSMFRDSNKLTIIPFDINIQMNTNIGNSLSNMFYGCNSLISLPKINNCSVDSTVNMFYSCHALREIPSNFCDAWDWSYREKANTSHRSNSSNMFYNCYSLRSFPFEILKHQNSYVNNSYSLYYYGFYNCFVLDEIVDLPCPYINTVWTINAFVNSFSTNGRLKNMTFALQEDGTPYIMKWKSQAIDLSNCVGYNSSDYTVLNYNSGITADKQVTDDTTYQALKDDPDWFTTDIAYSRYNHDSAVATINSLPDTSAYLAEKGGTNTIKFKGASGSSTDGGAINTLTEEEIAVATAKGWTVTLV